MIAENFINESVLPLKLSDTVDRALEWMEEQKVSCLPIVKDFQLIGLVNEAYLLEHQNLPLKETGLEFRKIACKSSDHIFDVVRIISQYNVTLIAVLDEKENYIGSVKTEDIFKWFCKQAAFQQEGGIIVLKINQNNYSLSQISQIVESNDSKILYSSILNNNTDPTQLKVILKINKQDITRLIASFERYEYSIEATFNFGSIRNQTQERLDNLIKFIDM